MTLVNLLNWDGKRIFVGAMAVILGCFIVVNTSRAEETATTTPEIIPTPTSTSTPELPPPPPPPPPTPVITINNPDTSFPEQVKIVTATASRGILTWQMLTDSAMTCGGSVQGFMPYEPAEFDDSQNGYRVCYRATDELGQTAYAVSNVITGIDATFPNLSLRGDAEMTVYIGNAYSDAGATAIDNVDGVVSVYSVGSVDTNVVGDYFIVYSTVDRAGNVASGLTRTIHVRTVPPPPPPPEPINTANTGNTTNPTNTTNTVNNKTNNSAQPVNVIFCSAVTYGDWLPCENGLQFRDAVSKSPDKCFFTSKQQEAKVRGCQVDYCSNVFYSPWSVCVGGKQTRTIISQVPNNCVVTAHQKLFTSKTCSAVLGQKAAASQPVAKSYPNGSLLRGPDKRIYVLINGQRTHVASLLELKKYRGRAINDVSDEMIARYPIVK
jgi:hypothetical protein